LNSFLISENNDKFIENTIFIVDEYDSLLFDKKKHLSNYQDIEKLRSFQRLIGISGSSISKIDQSII
jgi:sensor domain CHASE-containing protein